MIDIRPVTDLRYKFPEIEAKVKEGNAVYLTKNGYGSMVVLSIETYSNLLDGTEDALDEAEKQSSNSKQRLTHEEVFGRLREELNGK